MEREIAIALLKRQLLEKVSYLYARDKHLWKQPIVEVTHGLREAGVRAVFFGGTLRSLLVARALGGKPGRPRDIDIVVSGMSTDAIRERFLKMISRETRFGGLQLCRRDLHCHNWQFDVWPLNETWAFVHGSVAVPEFEALPSTTFFNLEAVAVDVWAQPGRPRRIYSGDDQFFEGILTKTLEINREENPFPELCVLRALVFSEEHGFKIGPRLAGYIARYGEALTDNDFDEIQHRHYGGRRLQGSALRAWIGFIAERHECDASLPISLQVTRQLEFWAETQKATRLRVHAMSV